MDRDGLVVSALNLSEGRHKAVLDEIVRKTPKQAKVLDIHSDPDHNRTVMTIAANLGGIEEAVLTIAGSCIGSIDLRRHEGAHPRMGALDVVPLVPIGGLEMDHVIEAASRLGKRLARDLRVPCFLYDLASESRTSLPEVRRSAFSFLMPDFGPAVPHPSAGATCIGARGHLVAFNVELHSSDFEAATRIARELREPDEGTQAIRALAIALRSKSSIQISMNLVDPLRVTPAVALERVERLAGARGVKVGLAEIVGLPPSACLSGLDNDRIGPRRTTTLEEALEKAFGVEL